MLLLHRFIIFYVDHQLVRMLYWILVTGNIKKPVGGDGRRLEMWSLLLSIFVENLLFKRMKKNFRTERWICHRYQQHTVCARSESLKGVAKVIKGHECSTEKVKKHLTKSHSQTDWVKFWSRLLKFEIRERLVWWMTWFIHQSFTGIWNLVGVHFEPYKCTYHPVLLRFNLPSNRNELMCLKCKNRLSVLGGVWS